MQVLTGCGTPEGLAALVLGSQEYLTNSGGGTTQGFLGALFCDTLDRPITSAELSSFGQQVSAGTARQAIAQAVLTSPEYQHVLVRTLYLSFLRRAPTASEEQIAVQELQSGTTDAQLIAILLGSQEYFNRLERRDGDARESGGDDRRRDQVTLTKPAAIDMVVLQVLPARRAHDSAAARSGSTAVGQAQPVAPRTRTVGVVHLGQHRAGRVTIRWNRQVSGHRLKRGSYLLVLQTRVGKRLTDVSDAIPFTVR